MNVKYVQGERNPADFWTRLWDKDVIDKASGNSCAILADIYFTYSDEDTKHIGRYFQSRKSSMGWEIKVDSGSEWKLYVPEMARRGLCWELNRNKHEGVVNLLSKLKRYHWPRKQRYLQDFVDSCICSAHKEGRRNKLKNYLPVEATAPLEKVAGDIYEYGNKSYITLMDIYSGLPWVLPLPGEANKVDVKRGMGDWTSEHGDPKWLLTDRGGEFGDVPNVVPLKTSSNHPQTDGKLERFHRELGNLSRIHKVDPTEAVKFYRTASMRRLFREPEVDRTERKSPFSVPVGEVKRSFEEGDYVQRYVQRRYRSKPDQVWSGVMKVVKKLGDRTYRITNGKRHYPVHVNDLKRYVLPHTAGWCVHPVDFKENLEEWNLEEQELLGLGFVLADLLKLNWSNKKIYSGVHFRHCEDIVEKMVAEKPELLVWVIPDLGCEQWFIDLKTIQSLQVCGEVWNLQTHYWMEQEML